MPYRALHCPLTLFGALGPMRPNMAPYKALYFFLGDQAGAPSRSTRNSRPTPKKAAAAPPHEIFARLRLAKQGATSALNSVKSAADKAVGELAQVTSVKTRLLQKNWPASLGEHLDVEAKKVEAKAAECKTYWAAESLLEVASLPDTLNGKEATLTSEQQNSIEKIIKEQNAKVTKYTATKTAMDGTLRSFVTGPLAGTLKIS